MRYNLEDISEDFKRGKRYKYLFFWGHRKSNIDIITKSCLSQWWSSDFNVDGVLYSCAEQFMMASKARLFNDEKILEKILKVKKPDEIKALGRKISNFNEEIWNKQKYNIVLKGNIAKFSQNKELKQFLISTKDRVLVEASPYDKVWGIGMKEGDNGIENPLTWRGENLLGFALMEVRDILIAE